MELGLSWKNYYFEMQFQEEMKNDLATDKTIL